MARLTYSSWRKRFVAAAKEDHYEEMNDLCWKSGCGAFDEKKGEPLMSGTKKMVAELAVYNDSFRYAENGDPRLFRWQAYHARKARGAKYIIVICDAYGRCARIIWDSFGFIDLADFHSNYVLQQLFVKKVNGAPFRRQDHTHLTMLVEDDIRVDFERDVKMDYTWAPDHFCACASSEKEDMGWIDPGTTVVFYRGSESGHTRDDKWLEGTVTRRGKWKLKVVVPAIDETLTVPLSDVLYIIRTDPKT